MSAGGDWDGGGRIFVWRYPFIAGIELCTVARLLRCSW